MNRKSARSEATFHVFVVEAGLSGQALRQIMGWAQLSTVQCYIDATGHAAVVIFSPTLFTQINQGE